MPNHRRSAFVSVFSLHVPPWRFFSFGRRRQPTLHTLCRCTFLMVCFVLLPTFASAQFQITSANISQSSIITYSNQSPTLTVSISRQPGFENYNVGVQATSPDGRCGAGFTIPGGTDAATGAFVCGGVGTQTSETITVTIAGGVDSKTTSVTLLPNTPTATFRSTSLPSPGSTTVQVTVLAPMPPSGGANVDFSLSPGATANGGPCPVAAGASSGTCTVSAVAGVTAPSQTTLTPYLNIGTNPNPTGAPTTVTVYPPSEPSLPCPPGNCEAQAAQPINLTNGNVWVTQHDYSLPGLGGGMSLDRTWNSLWATFRGSQPVAGMFGDSWRSTYEERLVSSGSSFIQYFRANGDAWWFQANGPSYQITNPPNQRATLVYDGTPLQYTMPFADGTKRAFSGTSAFLTALTDRNNNQFSITRDSSNRITQVADAASRTLSFAYANASFPLLATSATDPTGTVAP